MRPGQHENVGMVFENRDEIEAVRDTLEYGRKHKINPVAARVALDSMLSKKTVAALENTGYEYPVGHEAIEGIREVAETAASNAFRLSRARKSATFLLEQWPEQEVSESVDVAVDRPMSAPTALSV